MTRYLLDTNICVAVLNGRPEAVVRRFASQHPSSMCVCSVVVAELRYGAENSARRADNVRRIERFLEPLSSLAFDDGCAADYGAIRAVLASAGTPIGANDLLIAAIARHHDRVLVTRNLREFERVPGLRVECW